MNLQPLFTTSRVITAIYRIASTSLLLIYLVNRVREGRKFSKSVGRKRTVESYIEHH
jgi:hypothetical protein